MPRPPRLNDGFCPARSARRAVTLLELLVVIAIIALLIAILMPAMSKTHEQSRAVVCQSNLKQCLSGALTDTVEAPRREKRTTNFGWVIPVLRKNGMQTGIFTCPSDPDPKPIPTVAAKVYYLNRKKCRPDEKEPVEDDEPSTQPADPDTCCPNYVGPTAPEAVVNHLTRTTSGWELDIQNSSAYNWLGIDGTVAGRDFLMKYSANFQATSTRVTAVEIDRYSSYDILDSKNHNIWVDATDRNPPTMMSLVWMSYGVNALANIREPKSKTVFLAESCKFGVFPVKVQSARSFAREIPADAIVATASRGTPLRYRHGDPSADPVLRGADFTGDDPQMGTKPDLRYQPRSSMNAAYIDGHVERASYRTLSDPKLLEWMAGLSPDQVKHQ